MGGWSWQQEKLKQMTPEEVEAYKAKRKAQQKAAYDRAKQKRLGIEPPPKPAPKKRTVFKTPEERKEAEARYAERQVEAKRAHRAKKANERLNEFLAQGAPVNGFTAFLRSKEIRIADALTRPRGDIAA